MSTPGNKVGVVVVSYNASEAVRVTLASLRRARNSVDFKLMLIDNASEDAEREKIRAAMSTHSKETGGAWRYREEPTNLGFSGGNNIGITEFLNDGEISHICLLNSDVIVSDHWLDRLVAADSHIVSAVTNKADSEQCIPIDYSLELKDCLDHTTESIRDAAYLRVSNYAENWHAAWRGNLVETDVTFFCVLLTKSACREIGLLDDKFFPGGFEDDDYCLRAKQAGYAIHLARDTFIHHWGSASFGQLQYDYFTDKAKRNREYLETKHGFVWQRRPEKPIVSFEMDVNAALACHGPLRTQWPYLEMYIANLTKQIEYFESEFTNLSNALRASSRDVPNALGQRIKSAEAYGDIRGLWANTSTHIRRIANDLETRDEAVSTRISNDLKHIASGIHERVDCNFLIHAFLTSPSADTEEAADITLPLPATAYPHKTPQPMSRLGKFSWAIRHGLKFLWQFDGIVFFGGYFYPERQSDGYFQRIRIVDELFKDHWRVYVESTELKGRNIWLDRPEPKVLVLRINGGGKRRMLVRLLALLAVFRGRKAYFHSVLRMYDNRFGKLLHVPLIKTAVDIHGVVPEEFRMHNDFFSALIYEKEEHTAVKKAGLVVVVTEAMRNYFKQKFRDEFMAKSTCFPMFPTMGTAPLERPLIDGKPVVVYAGGLHKWQQVPKMIDAIDRTVDRCTHRFYCPQPEVVSEMLPPAIRGLVTIGAKSHSELIDIYSECHYGFILREDIIVNRAACPTKLVEYIAMGIVPIVDSEEIGDFKSLGLQFVRLDDFLHGRMPNEQRRLAMAEANVSVYSRLKEARQTGAEDIHTFFYPEKSLGSRRTSPIGIVKRLLPPTTRRGKLARRLLKRSTRTSKDMASNLNLVHASALHPTMGRDLSHLACDILVQVDNFEAGGLENVVLDLNRTLMATGYRVVLLVLGLRGAAVTRAIELQQTVISYAYSDETYSRILNYLRPKLVLAHYSIKGVPICARRSIPFVQVMHNVYMWFTAEQREEFARMGSMTHTFVAVSDFVRRYSVSKLGIPAQKCTTIPNGIDFHPFDSLDLREARTRLRKKYNIDDHEFVFLSVASINHQKNHIGTIKAFHIAAQTCPQSRLLILGPIYENELFAEISAYIREHALQERVLYCGAAPDSREHMAMADAFASGSFFEGSALTLLEALKANLAIVTADVGNASQFRDRNGVEVVEPAVDMLNYNGSIVDLTSNRAFEERLAAAMVRTWKNRLRPNFTPAQLAVLEKSHTYAQYITLISSIIATDAEDLGGYVPDLKSAS